MLSIGCACSSFCWLSSVVPVTGLFLTGGNNAFLSGAGVGISPKENFNELPDADDGVVGDPKEELTGVELFLTGVGISPVGSLGPGLDPNTKLVEEAGGLAAGDFALLWAPNRPVLVLVLVLVLV